MVSNHKGGSEGTGWLVGTALWFAAALGQWTVAQRSKSEYPEVPGVIAIPINGCSGLGLIHAAFVPC